MRARTLRRDRRVRFETFFLIFPSLLENAKRIKKKTIYRDEVAVILFRTMTNDGIYLGDLSYILSRIVYFFKSDVRNYVELNRIWNNSVSSLTRFDPNFFIPLFICFFRARAGESSIGVSAIIIDATRGEGDFFSSDTPKRGEILARPPPPPPRGPIYTFAPSAIGKKRALERPLGRVWKCCSSRAGIASATRVLFRSSLIQECIKGGRGVSGR